jgi:hypothetical protein
MKNNAMKWILAAVAVVGAAGNASAQVLKADVPFTFRAGGATMSAGTYIINVDGASRTLTIADERGHYDALIMANSRIEGGKEGDAKLVFRCAESCSLVQAWSGTPGIAYNFKPQNPGHEEGYLTVIHLRLDKSR